MPTTRVNGIDLYYERSGDGIAPLANSEAIAEHVAGSELRVYEGGHAFFAQDPRAVPDIIDFLTGPR